MPLEDPNHTRRSLVVTSMAFIAFSLGGGHIKDNSLSLPLVNIEFEHVWGLAGLAWIGLFWFAFRYWQEHWSAYIATRVQELSEFLRPSKRLISLTSKAMNIKYIQDFKNGASIGDKAFDKIKREGFFDFWSLTLELNVTILINQRKQNSSETMWSHAGIETAKVCSLPLKIQWIIYSVVKCNTITSMFAPYWLFIAAVITGGYRVWESLSQTPALAW